MYLAAESSGVKEEAVGDELEAALHREHCSEEVVEQPQGLHHQTRQAKGTVALV